MYKTINGWTKEAMKKQVEDNFKGLSIDKGTCLYRGPNGNKCAIGCFISDESYLPEMECGALNPLLNKFQFLQASMPLDRTGLSKFQWQHDSFAKIRHGSKEYIKSTLIDWIDENVVD